MKKYLLGCAAAAISFGFGGVAQAATFTPADCTAGNIHFCVTGDAQAPDVDNYITAVISNSFTGSTAVDDTFLFAIDKNGVGSGGIQTSFSSGNTTFSLTDLIINGVSYAGSIVNTSAGSSVNVNGIAILSGVDNTIRVIGSFMPSTSDGRANYSGNLTFTAAIPEASTWAMMMLGMGGVGFAMRRRRQSAKGVRVTYA